MKIDVQQIQSDVKKAIQEDVGTGDVTAALLPENTSVSAEIIAREPMLMCGQPWVMEVFHHLNPAVTLQWLAKEGEYIDKPTVICKIVGNARAILTAERTALNFLQTLSATATRTYQAVQSLQGTQTQLLDTRKTIPGLRYAQKYAVTCGGGKNHRMGLYDAFLIKENHIKAAGSITKAIAAAKQLNQHLMIEVEVENLTELQEALKATPNRILLDNFTPDLLKQAVAINEAFGCELEASGGLDQYDLKTIAQTGVDFISMGALTKSIKAIDLSLLIRDEI